MPTQDALLDQIARSVEAAKTEAGEVNAVIEKLVLEGYLNIPEATMVKAKDGRMVRVYLWESTPAGDFALITGPDVDGRVVSNEELQGICQVAREMPQILVELEAADPSIEQDLEETIERKAKRLEYGEIKAPPKGKKKTRVTFLAKVEKEIDRLEEYLDTGDGRSTRLVNSLEKKIGEVYWPSVEWRDRILPRFQQLKSRWELQSSERTTQKEKTKTGRRGRPKADREIYVTMRWMDGDERRKFGTLKGAQRWAQEYFGEIPGLISGEVVHGDDGGKLLVEGATFRELFPRYFAEQTAIIEEEEAPPSDEEMMAKLKETMADLLGDDEEEYEEEEPDIPEGVQPGIIEESVIVEDVPEKVLRESAPASDAEQMEKFKSAMADIFADLDL